MNALHIQKSIYSLNPTSREYEERKICLDAHAFGSRGTEESIKNCTNIAEEIDKVLEDTKSDYFHYLRQFLQGARLPNALCHPFFSRNTVTSTMLRSLSILKLVERGVLLKSDELVTSNVELAMAISLLRKSTAQSWALIPVLILSLMGAFFRFYATCLFSVAKHTVRRLKIWFDQKKSKKVDFYSAEKHVIFSFVDAALISKEQGFIDRYYKDIPLLSEIDPKDILYVFVPVGQIDESQALKKIREKFPFSYTVGQLVSLKSFVLMVCEYIAVMLHVSRGCLAKKSVPLGVRILFLKDLLQYGPTIPVCGEGIVKGILQKGFKPLTLLNSFENQEYEKRLIHAARRYLPQTFLVGFQHSAPFKNFLLGWPIEEEVENRLLPDRIVTNGKKFHGMLKKELNSNSEILAGPTIRVGQPLPQILNVEKSQSILVICSINPVESAVLVFRVHAALRVLKSTAKILVRLHPMMEEKEFYKMLQTLGIGNVSEQTLLVLERHLQIDAVLQSARVAIAQSTGAILDVVRAGIPVVNLGDLFSISLEIQCDSALAQLVRTVYSQADLSKFISEHLEATPEFQNTARARLQDWYLDFFMPAEKGTCRSLFFAT